MTYRLPTPSKEQIRTAFEHSDKCYSRNLNFSSRVILVPHAAVIESYICTASAMRFLDQRIKKVFIIGTEHHKCDTCKDVVNKIDEESDYASIEHSLYINGAFLDYLGISYEYLIVKNNSDIAASKLFELLNENENIGLVVTSDLTHYKLNQQTVITNENRLIEGLINSDSDLVSSSVSDSSVLNACGWFPLITLSKLAKMMKLTGSVTCYTDSLGKRRYWYNGNREKHVSYVGIAYDNKRHQTGFEDQLLIAYSKSCLMSYLFDVKKPVIPSWSMWKDDKRGAFVGIEYHGNTVASKGVYDSSSRSLIENICDATLTTPDDSYSRWKFEITIDNFDDLEFHINILDKKSDWINKEKDQHITSDDNYGLYLEYPNGMAATYLPSVWKELNVSFAELMEMLSKKSGNKPLSWKNATVKLYKTILIEEC